MVDPQASPPDPPLRETRKYAEDVSKESIRDSKSGRTLAFGILIVLLFPITAYLLVCFWPHYRQEAFMRPPTAGAGGDTATAPASRWVRTEGVMSDTVVLHTIAICPPDSVKRRGLCGPWIRQVPFAIEPEKRFLIIALLAGVLGGLVHEATSFGAYVGGLQLLWSWGWYYALRPFIGGGLALIVYFVLRAGLIAGSNGVDQLNPYGVAAICGLCGMFSKQASKKLQEVLEQVLNVSDRLPDKLKSGDSKDDAGAAEDEQKGEDQKPGDS